MMTTTTANSITRSSKAVLGEDHIQKVKDSTLAMLEETDEIAGTKMAKMWRHIVSIQDTNELIRLEISRVQLMITEHFNDMFRRRAERECELKEAMRMVKESNDDDRSGLVDIYVTLRDAAAKEKKEDYSAWQRMAGKEQSLASEYRQCAMQKKYSVHISTFQKFVLIVKNRLHMEITDPKLRERIARGIGKDMLQHFPASVDTEF